MGRRVFSKCHIPVHCMRYNLVSVPQWQIQIHNKLKYPYFHILLPRCKKSVTYNVMSHTIKEQALTYYVKICQFFLCLSQKKCKIILIERFRFFVHFRVFGKHNV